MPTDYYLYQDNGATIYVEAVSAHISAVVGDQNTVLMSSADATFAVDQFPVFGEDIWKTPGEA